MSDPTPVTLRVECLGGPMDGQEVDHRHYGTSFSPPRGTGRYYLRTYDRAPAHTVYEWTPDE